MVLGDDVSSKLQRCAFCASYYHRSCWENPDAGSKKTKEEVAHLKAQRREAKEKAKEEKAKKKDRGADSDSSDSSVSSSSSPSSSSPSDSSSSENDEEDANTPWICPDCVPLHTYLVFFRSFIQHFRFLNKNFGILARLRMLLN
jgi:hypothetical protein